MSTIEDSKQDSFEEPIMNFQYIFQECQKGLVALLNGITSNQREFTLSLNNMTAEMVTKNSEGTITTEQIYEIMYDISEMMVEVAIYFDKFAPQMETIFNMFLYSCSQIASQSCDEQVKHYTECLHYLSDSIAVARDGFIQQRASLDSFPDINDDITAAKERYRYSLESVISTFDRSIDKNSDLILHLN